MTFLADCRSAARLARFYSRADFRAVPLEFVLWPCLDAPILVHVDPPLFVDRDGSMCLALAMLTEGRDAYRGIRDPVKREQFDVQLSVLWDQLIDQASYYTWPDAPVELYEFRPDDLEDT